MVEVPEPGAAMDTGLNAAVTPVGCPEADKATALSKPDTAVVVMVELPLLPGATETDVGEAAMVKLGVVTVRDTDTVSVTPPPVPVTVIG
jgi:hypothetical protein